MSDRPVDDHQFNEQEPIHLSPGPVRVANLHTMFAFFVANQSFRSIKTGAPCSFAELPPWLTDIVKCAFYTGAGMVNVEFGRLIQDAPITHAMIQCKHFEEKVDEYNQMAPDFNPDGASN